MDVSIKRATKAPSFVRCSTWCPFTLEIPVFEFVLWRAAECGGTVSCPQLGLTARSAQAAMLANTNEETLGDGERDRGP